MAAERSPARRGVHVSFADGQLDKDTEVAFKRNAGGPPPLPYVLPLDQPVDISLDKPSRGGTVTMSYQLPPELAGHDAAVVMLIEEGGTWRMVPSTVDPVRHTVTGAWPHFSRGVPGVVDMVLDAPGAAWDAVKAGANWTGRSFKSIATGIATTAVGLTGGTTDAVKCEPSSGYWTVTSSKGMTGCVGERNPDGSWPAKVNVRYPYPMLVPLPSGTTGPAWSEILPSYDLADFAVAMIASRYGQLIVPAGKTAPFRIVGPVAADLELSGAQDPYTLAIRAAALIAALLSDGITATELAAGKAAIARIESALEREFLAARKAGDTSRTLAEYIRATQGKGSLLDLRKKELADQRNKYAAGKAFDYLDYLDCAKASYVTYQDVKTKSVRDKVVGAAKLMIDECLPALVDATAQAVAVVRGLTGQDPAEQQKQGKALALEILKSFKDIESLTLSSLGNIVASISFGKYDPTKATVAMARPKVDVVAAARDEIVASLKKAGFPTTTPADPQQSYINRVGPDFIRYGRNDGLLDTVRIVCPGPRMRSGPATAFARTGRSS